MSREKCNHCGRLYGYQPGDSVYCTIGCKQDAEAALDARDAVLSQRKGETYAEFLQRVSDTHAAYRASQAPGVAKETK